MIRTSPAAVGLRAFLTTLVLLAACGSPVRAQYDDPRFGPPTPARFAGVTVGHKNFTPQGIGLISFNTMIVGLILHQDPVELQLGYGSYTLGKGDRTSLSLASTVSFDLPLQGSPRGGIMVPIMVVGDYTKAESDGLSRDDFTIGSIGIGGGIKAKISGDRWELSGRGAIAAQYAFEGFSVGTGFSPLLLADVTATFRAIPVFEGIAAGYRFRFQRWSMNDSQFDYRSMEHTVFVGVMF